MVKTEKGNSYLKERAGYLFDKLVKKTDRVSIVKFNTGEGIKIECNLILKENGETVLKKEIEGFFVINPNLPKHFKGN